jgi:hypothetical protein
MAAPLPSYVQWYGSPQQDPFHGAYTDICQAFDAEAANAPTAAALLTSVATGPDQRAAFVLLGEDDLIHVIHRLRRQMPALGMAASGYDNRNFGTYDDLGTLGPATVEVPVQFFQRTGLLPMRTSAVISAALGAAAPPSFQLPPLAVGDPTAELIRARKCTFIPPPYVSMILAGASAPGGLSPHRLWQEAAQAVLNDCREGECQSFVNWCRIAVSHGEGADNPLRQAGPVLVVAPDGVLSAGRHAIHSADLPQRYGAVVADLGQIVQTIGALRADASQRDAALIARSLADKAATRLPSTRWFEPTQGLLNLCQVDTDGDLPNLFKDMARAGKKEDRVTIQYHLKTTAASKGQGTVAPVCSSELAKDIGALNFAAPSRDDIMAGLSIFAVCHPDQASQQLASELAGHFDGQMSGVVAPSLAESIALKAAQGLQLPTQLLQLKWILAPYGLLLEVVLGQHHPVVASYNLFLRKFERAEVLLHGALEGHALHTAGFLRFVQLKMYRWISDQVAASDPIPAPDFGAIIDSIEDHTWLPAPLPGRYLVHPPRVSKGPLPTPLTAPLGPAPPSTSSATRVQKAAYVPAPVADLDSARIKPRTKFDIKAHITAHGPPPVNEAGGLMCLSFHVRGSCSVDCDRGPSSGGKNDHKRHGASESTRLAAYLNLAGPTTATGSSE